MITSPRSALHPFEPFGATSGKVWNGAFLSIYRLAVSVGSAAVSDPGRRGTDVEFLPIERVSPYVGMRRLVLDWSGKRAIAAVSGPGAQIRAGLCIEDPAGISNSPPPADPKWLEIELFEG